MTRIEAIERKIASFSEAELAVLREWFAEFDAAAWDRQIEEDVRSDKLDELVQEALGDLSHGKGTNL